MREGRYPGKWIFVNWFSSLSGKMYLVVVFWGWWRLKSWLFYWVFFFLNYWRDTFFNFLYFWDRFLLINMKEIYDFLILLFFSFCKGFFFGYWRFHDLVNWGNCFPLLRLFLVSGDAVVAVVSWLYFLEYHSVFGYFREIDLYSAVGA